MAAVTHSVLTGAWFPVLRLRTGFARLAQSLSQRRLRYEQMRELTTFSDRELRDVGLSRSDFMAIEKGVYRRD